MTPKYKYSKVATPIKVIVIGRPKNTADDFHPLALRFEEEEMVREVRRSLNAYYYGENR
jgi:hypothetical protein